MPYQVRITRPGLEHIGHEANWYSDQNEEIGRAWYQGVRAAIESLSDNPDRFGLAHESEEFPFELREILYGLGRRKTHRILFRIEGRSVDVLAIWHVSRRDLSPEDIET